MGETRVIRAGQYASVGQDKALSVGERRGDQSDKRFTRVMPVPLRRAQADDYAALVLSMKPAVYYRMEEWPKGKDKDTYVLVDSAPGGHHGVLHHDDTFGPPYCRGRFGRALDLRGSMGGDYAIVPDYPKTETGQLSVSAWVWATTLDPYAAIVQNFWASPSGRENTGQFFLGTDDKLGLTVIMRQQNGVEAMIFGGNGKVLPRGQWQHIAFVADGAVLRLYHNGVEVGMTPYHGIARQPLSNKGLGVGCQTDEIGASPRPDMLSALWTGRLDEIAIFNHALTSEQVRQLSAEPAVATRPFTQSPSSSIRNRSEDRGFVCGSRR